MLQKDYILRMVEMLGDLIAGILGLIKKGDIQQAGEKIEKLYHDFLREDASFFRSLPDDQLTARLIKGLGYTNGHLEILAELFDVEAELALARGDTKTALEYSGKSLLLMVFIDKEYRTYSQDRINKMDRIRKRIAGLEAGLYS
jgi:hypothetical protein